MAPDIFIQVPEVWTWGTWEVQVSNLYPHHAITASLPFIQPQTKNIKHTVLIVALSCSGGGHTVGRWLVVWWVGKIRKFFSWSKCNIFWIVILKEIWFSQGSDYEGYGLPEYDTIYTKNRFIGHLQDREIAGYFSFLDITLSTWMQDEDFSLIWCLNMWDHPNFAYEAPKQTGPSRSHWARPPRDKRRPASPNHHV